MWIMVNHNSFTPCFISILINRINDNIRLISIFIMIINCHFAY